MILKYILVILLVWTTPAWAVFPTTGVLSTCNIADEDPLSDGGKWTTTFFIATHGLRVVSTDCAGASGFRSESYWNVATFGPNAEAYAILTNGTATLAADFYFALRVTSPGASMNGYLADLSYSGSGNAYSINAYSVVAGVATGIISGAGPITINPGDVIGASIVGDVLTVYLNGTDVAHVTDATAGRATGAGSIGLGINDVTSNTIALQSFGGGTLSGGTPSTTITGPVTISGPVTITP